MGALADAAANNDRRQTLIALRNSLAETIDDCESGRDMAALSKRLMEVMAELDTIPNPDDSKRSAVQSKRDDLKKRRGRS